MASGPLVMLHVLIITQQSYDKNNLAQREIVFEGHHLQSPDVSVVWVEDLAKYLLVLGRSP